MNLERFWAVYADSYDLMWDSPATAATRATVHRAIGDAATVVDLGCGTGLMSTGFIARGIDVIGVDNSDAMLGRALARGRISRAVRAEAQSTGLGAGVADAVVVGNVLHLHPHPAAVIAEAQRLLAPGGVIVATWPVPGLSPGAMWRADRRAGRSFGSSLRAHLLRVRIGLLAARTSGVLAARAAGAHDTGALLASLGLESTHHIATVADCQHVIVL